MKILAAIVVYWAATAAAAVVAIGRVLDIIPEPPLPDDYLADQPVDCWSDTRVDAEFWALVSPYEVRS